MQPEPEEILTLTPSGHAHAPRFHELTRRQIEYVLSRNHVARVAFISADRVELRPVHYVYYAGALYGRTTFETKGLTWLVQPEVVFEVDEVDDTFDWRSVIVRGQVSLLRRDGPPDQASAYWVAVDAIRTFIPAAFAEHDPTPDREAAFRIDPSEMTGREASTR